jgi:uncharacterized membrane protein YhdT
MDRFNALGRGAQMMLVGGVLLFIDLFLTWEDLGLVEGAADELDSFSGWSGFAGIVLGLLTIVLIAWLIVRLASVDIPLPVSTAMTGALLGTLILIFAIIKVLTVLGDATIWAWIGLALAVVIAVGAFQVVQQAGGIDQLKSEIPNMPAQSAQEPSREAPSATQAPPPPPPAAPSQETAPAPAPPPSAAPPAESPPTSEPDREEERPA